MKNLHLSSSFWFFQRLWNDHEKPALSGLPKLRTLTLLICTTLLHLTTLAQPGSTFITSFDPNPQNMFQADKGKAIWSIGKYIYVINGFVKNSIGDRKNQLYKIDADTREFVGDIEFEGPQGDMAITAHWVTSDNHILLTGEWRDKAANFTMRMFLAKLTPDLEVVWINYYPDLSSNFLYSDGITETSDGDYLMYLVEGPPPAPHVTGELRVIKTDTSGAILLSTLLVDTFTLTVGYGDIIPTDDGYFLISSYAKGFYYHPILGTYREVALLHKIDADANTLWSKSLNYAKFTLQSPALAAIAGGGGAVAWMKDTLTTDPEIAWNFILLHGIDGEGNIKWTYEWNKWPYKTIYSIKQANNGDILGTCFYGAGGFPNRGKGMIFRLSDDGDLIWERHYSDSLLRPWAPQMELLDVCELEDGRIAATGLVFDSNGEGVPWNANVVLLVIDSQGCAEPGCVGATQYITATSEPLFTFENLPVLGVSPNPSTGPALISLPETLAMTGEACTLRAYSPDGQLLQQLEWPAGTRQLPVNDWKAPGLCYLFLFDRRGYPLASGKILFQN